MGDIKRSGSSGWKNGSHKKIKSKPQLTKNLLIVRCRLAFDGVMGFLCINSSLKTDCFHFLQNDNPKIRWLKRGPRSQKTFRFLQPCLSMCLGIFSVYMTHLWFFYYVVGGRLESIYLWGRNFRGTPGRIAVSDWLSRDDDIYDKVNSWAVGTQLLGSAFIHLQLQRWKLYSCNGGLAFGGF